MLSVGINYQSLSFKGTVGINEKRKAAQARGLAEEALQKLVNRALRTYSGMTPGQEMNTEVACHLINDLKVKKNDDIRPVLDILNDNTRGHFVRRVFEAADHVYGLDSANQH